MIQKCIKNIDRKKACEMLIGILGIYSSYLLVGIIYQKITSTQYLNTNNQQHQYFRLTSGYIMIQRSITWLFALIYRQFTLPKQKRVQIQHKSSAATGFMIWLSNWSQTQAMYYVSFPLIVMAKSCSLISVILVGVCCSRVRTKQLKLGPQKIIIAAIVTIGILMFRIFDPNNNLASTKSTQILGLVLLAISLFADGFTPDFQAAIKQKSNPSSIEMLMTINKWSAIFAFLYLLVKGEVKDMFYYCLYHQQFLVDLLIMTVAAFVGQLFIYRMIKQFKQHVVPFVVTTRKIFTVGLSILYYHHSTSWGQILSILLVLIITVYQFTDNITKVEQEVVKFKEIKQMDEQKFQLSHQESKAQVKQNK